MKKDTGWAWAVVTASFTQRIFAYGLTTTTGILYVVFKEEFQQSSGMTSIVGSLANATSFFLGPVSSVLCNRYGNRTIVMVAGVIAGVGLVTSMFATSIYWLMISYGIITGIGFGLTLVPASCVVAQYFDKKRNLAMGIASSGGGLGSFIFPPLLQTLINTYGWKGTMLISGALALNVSACGAIYRAWPAESQQSKDQSAIDADDNCNTANHNKRHIDADQNNKDSTNDNQRNENSKNVCDICANENNARDGCPHVTLVVNSNSNCEKTNWNKTESESNNNRTRKAKHFHWEMFRNKKFIVLCTNNTMATLGFSILYVHLIAYAQTGGIDKDSSAWLFTVMGSMNLFGKFGLGVLAHHPKISEHLLYIVSLGIGGIATVALPLIPIELPSLMIYASIAGLSVSALGGALIPALLVDYAGIDALSSTFGVLLITNGIGFFSGAPIAGVLYDNTNDYQASFYLAGVVILISTVMMLLPWRFMKDKEDDLIIEDAAASAVLGIEDGEVMKQLSPNLKRTYLFDQNRGSVEGLDRVVASQQDLRSISSGQ